MKSVDYVVVHNKLKTVTKLYKDVINLIDEKSVLCGGLVLQTIIGEKWDTDIDIFTTETDLSKFKSTGVWDKSLNAGYDCISGVTNVFRGHLHDGTPSDIIQITNLSELFNGFDFEFCKCWFDGTNIHAINTESILTKSCDAINWSGARNFEKRCEKYRKRGFTINITLEV